MNEAGAAMSLFDIGIWCFASANGFNEVRQMPLVGKVTFILVNDLAAFDQDLPTASVLSQAHQALGAIDFYACSGSRPVRPGLAVPDLTGELIHIIGSVPAFTGHCKITEIVKGCLHLRNFAFGLVS